jgi:hypothetical protein
MPEYLLRRAFIAAMCSCFARAVEFRSLFLYNAFSVHCRSTFSEGLSLPQCAPVSLEQSSFVLFFCTLLFLFNAALPNQKGFCAAVCPFAATVFFIVPCSFLQEWLPSPGLACCNGLCSCFAILSVTCGNVARPPHGLSNLLIRSSASTRG